MKAVLVMKTYKKPQVLVQKIKKKRGTVQSCRCSGSSTHGSNPTT